MLGLVSAKPLHVRVRPVPHSELIEPSIRNCRRQSYSTLVLTLAGLQQARDAKEGYVETLLKMLKELEVQRFYGTIEAR